MENVKQLFLKHNIIDIFENLEEFMEDIDDIDEDIEDVCAYDDFDENQNSDEVFLYY